MDSGIFPENQSIEICLKIVEKELEKVWTGGDSYSLIREPFQVFVGSKHIIFTTIQPSLNWESVVHRPLLHNNDKQPGVLGYSSY